MSITGLIRFAAHDELIYSEALMEGKMGAHCMCAGLLGGHGKQRDGEDKSVKRTLEIEKGKKLMAESAEGKIAVELVIPIQIY